jgi:hypothetical protein
MAILLAVSRVFVHLSATVLIVLMIFFSLMLWIGIPLGWLFIGSQLVSTTQPSMGPYMVVGVGIVASVIVDAMVLSRLHRAYQKVTGGEGTVRIQLPWLRSMRGERTSGRPTSVLDIIMVCSVALAALAATLWFFLLAGSPTPTGGG